MDILTDDDLLEFLKVSSAPPKEPEFRLYYDESGNVLYYSCEEPAGNYIVVDRQVYAESRYDIRVINGKIVDTTEFTYTQKLIPSDNGYRCAKENVNIIVPNEYTGETITWDIKQYEQQNS